MKKNVTGDQHFELLIRRGFSRLFGFNYPEDAEREREREDTDVKELGDGRLPCDTRILEGGSCGFRGQDSKERGLGRGSEGASGKDPAVTRRAAGMSTTLRPVEQPGCPGRWELPFCAHPSREAWDPVLRVCGAS